MPNHTEKKENDYVLSDPNCTIQCKQKLSEQRLKELWCGTFTWDTKLPELFEGSKTIDPWVLHKSCHLHQLPTTLKQTPQTNEMHNNEVIVQQPEGNVWVLAFMQMLIWREPLTQTLQ